MVSSSLSSFTATHASIATAEAMAQVWVAVEWYSLKRVLMEEAMQPQALYHHWQGLVVQRAKAVGATVLKWHQGVVFFSFVDELSLADAVESALAFCLELSHAPVVLKDTPLPVRAGLALALPNAQKELLTATERQLAPKNCVVVHEDVVKLIGRKRYPFQNLLALPQRPPGLGNALANDSLLGQYYFASLVEPTFLAKAQQGNTGVLPPEPSHSSSKSSSRVTSDGLPPLQASEEPAKKAVRLNKKEEKEHTSRLEVFLANTAIHPDAVEGETLSEEDVMAHYTDGFDDHEAELFGFDSVEPFLEGGSTPVAVAKLPNLIVSSASSSQAPLPSFQQTLQQQVAPVENALPEPELPSASVVSVANSALLPESPAAFPVEPPPPERVPEPVLVQQTLTALEDRLIAALRQQPSVGTNATTTPCLPVLGKEQDYLTLALQQACPVPTSPTPPVYWATTATEIPEQRLTYQQAVEWLQQDLTAFARANQAQPSRGVLRLLQAPSGYGKSSILQMVRSVLEPPVVEEGQVQEPSPFVWFMGSAWQATLAALAQGVPPLLTQTTLYPLQLWADVFRNLFNLPPDLMEPETAKQQIEQVLQHLYGNPVPAEVLKGFSQLLHLSPAQPLPYALEPLLEQGFYVLLDCLQRAAQFKPLVLVLEDCDEADVASLEALSHFLASGLLEHPVYLVLTTQQGQHPTEALLGDVLNPGNAEEQALCLNLQPFDYQSGAAFLEAGPMNGQLHRYPKGFIENLLTASQGLPLWLEEHIRYLTLKGVLSFDEASQALLPKNPETLALSEVLHNPESILEQRSLALEEGQRLLLKMAAILGPRFSMEALEAVSGVPQDTLQNTLQLLWEQGWVMPDVGGGVAFRHTLLWRYWLQVSPKAQQTAWHAQVCERFQQKLEQEGRCLPTGRLALQALLANEPEMAFHAMNTAAVEAVQLGSLWGGSTLFTMALEVLPGSLPSHANVRSAERNDVEHSVRETLARLHRSTNPAFSEQMFLSLLSRVHHARQRHQVEEYLQHLSVCLKNQGYLAHSLNPLESIKRSLPHGSEWQAQRLAVALQQWQQLAELEAWPALQEAWGGQTEPPLEAQQAFSALELAPMRTGLLLACGQLPQAQQLLEEALKTKPLPEILTEPLFESWLALGHLAKQQQHYKVLQGVLNHTLNLLNTAPAAPVSFTALRYSAWGLMALEAHLNRGDGVAAETLLQGLENQLKQAKWPLGQVRYNMAWAQFYLVVAAMEHEPPVASSKDVATRDFLEKWSNNPLLPQAEAKLQEAEQVLRSMGHQTLGVRLALLRLELARLAALPVPSSSAFTPNFTPKVSEQQACTQAVEAIHSKTLPHVLLKQEVQLAQVHFLLRHQAVSDAEALLKPLWEKHLRQHPFPAFRAAGALAIGSLFFAKIQAPSLHQEASALLSMANQAEAFTRRSLVLWQQLENPVQQNKAKALLMELGAT